MKKSQDRNPANLLLTEIVARMRVWLDRAKACIDQLDEAQMWYRPNSSSNAIGNLVLHLVGNLRQWILGGIGNQPDTRDRPAEFAATTGHSKSQLISLLHDTVEQSCDVIGKLATNRIMERKLIQGEHVTIAYAWSWQCRTWAYMWAKSSTWERCCSRTRTKNPGSPRGPSRGR